MTAGIYVIVDVTALGKYAIDPLAFADACLAERPSFLQLRAKHASPSAVEALASELVCRTRAAAVPFVMNDDADAALRVGATHVHLGQDDEALASARERVGARLGYGISTHDLAQLERALAWLPSYVAFGPVFGTTSKEAPEPVVGAASFREASARARAAGIPIVAIGGIDPQNAHDVGNAADHVAVIGALVNAMRERGRAGVRDVFAGLRNALGRSA